MVSVEYSESMVEILDILKHSDDSIIEKIPKKLINFWEKNKSTTYRPNLNHSKPLNDMVLKDMTKSLIAFIYLNYLCESENEKNKLNFILRENEKKYNDELKIKYDTNDIFKNNNKNSTILKDNHSKKNKENNDIIELKENFFHKLIKKIKVFFYKKF